MISVIISTYNSGKYLGECLDSVLKSEGVDYEILVVDAGTPIFNFQFFPRLRSGPRFGSAIFNQFSISKFKNIKFKRFSKNVGLTVSSNAGAKLARGEYLLFLDVDTKIDKNALSEMVRFFDKNPNCGVVQGKLVDARTGKTETRGHFLSVFGFPYEMNKITNYQLPITNEISNSNFQKRTPIIFGARGACLGIRREVFEKVGGFDEDFFMHNEETDLCWRVWLSGYRIYYLPSAVVRHYGKSHYMSATSGESDRRFALSATPEEAYRRIFYEGAKNQITMIIKNADLKMILWMLPLNILGWISVGFKSVWVYRGMGKAFLNLGKTIGKRKKVLRVKNNEANKIMFGEIGFFELLKKGWKWVKNQ